MKYNTYQYCNCCYRSSLCYWEHKFHGFMSSQRMMINWYSAAECWREMFMDFCNTPSEWDDNKIPVSFSSCSVYFFSFPGTAECFRWRQWHTFMISHTFIAIKKGIDWLVIAVQQCTTWRSTSHLRCVNYKQFLFDFIQLWHHTISCSRFLAGLEGPMTCSFCRTAG